MRGLVGFKSGYTAIALLLIFSFSCGCVSIKAYKELEYERNKERTARQKVEESLRELKNNLTKKKLKKESEIENIQGLEDEVARLQAEVDRLQTVNKSYLKDLRINKVNLIIARSEKAKGTLDLVINKETGGVVLKHDLLFVDETLELSVKAKAILQALGKVLNTPELINNIVFVDGHTNSTPVKIHKTLYPDNWALGARRAAQVRNYLQNLGVSPARLVLRSYGYTVPLYPDKPDAPGNRRVEILIGEKIPQ